MVGSNGLDGEKEWTRLELRLFLEEHAETDDSPVDQQASDDGHDHGGYVDEMRVCEDGGKGYRK